MTVNLEGLVHFISEEEPTLVKRVKDAVHWFASTPEGKYTLEEAVKLHGSPIQVFTHSEVAFPGFGIHNNLPTIFANPRLTDSAKLLCENGEHITTSMDRFICHEFTHATQPNVIEHAQPFIRRKAEIMSECMPHVPLEDYHYRLTVANTDAELGNVYGKIYDDHIADIAPSLPKKIAEKAAQDEVCRAHFETYEKPAIEFENKMMAKYRAQPGRITDYGRSGEYEATLIPLDRQHFVESAVAAHKESKAATRGLGILR